MRKSLIKLLFLVILTFAVSVSGIAQDRTVSARFVETGTSTMENVLNFRITFSRLVWTVEGTPSACSFKMEQSDDGITWSDFTPASLDCTSSGKTEFISAPFAGKFLRHSLTTLTGSGIIRPFWDGFRGDGCGRDYDGIFSVESSTDPSAGAELSITVPSSERWRVYSSSFELQADSTVEDREVFLVVSEGSDEYFRTFADGVVKSDQLGIFTSAALGFVGTAGLGPSSINQPTDVRTIMIPIYSDAFVPGGHTLATDTGGLQAGDDYSAVVALVEKCPN